MKTITTTAIVALMTATIGLSTIAPTFAQSAAPVQAEQNNFRHNNNQDGPRRGGPMGGGDFLNFERGSEAVEIAFVRLSHNLELTAAQQPLFDAFKTAALAAANDFATATEGLRPTPPSEADATATGTTTTTTEPVMPSITERLDNRVAMVAAQLKALESIQPSATAFFNSLTDEQTAQLTPQRPEGDGFGKGGPRHGGDHKGPGPHGGPDAGPAPMPGEAPAPDAAPAPGAAPAEAPADAPAPAVNG